MHKDRMTGPGIDKQGSHTKFYQVFIGVVLRCLLQDKEVVQQTLDNGMVVGDVSGLVLIKFVNPAVAGIKDTDRLFVDEETGHRGTAVDRELSARHTKQLARSPAS